MSKKTRLLIGLACLVLGAALLKRVTVLAYLGMPKYQDQLGLEYSPKNYEAASKWFDKAARKNLASAEYHYGTLLENGQGLEKDLAAARFWYQKAADQGYAEAMEALRRLTPKKSRLVLDSSNGERDLAIKICTAWNVFEEAKAATSLSDLAGQQKVVSLYDIYYHLRQEFKQKYGEGREVRVDMAMRQHGLCRKLLE
jgi:TPR repeat protein